uniref:Uncharacterized protein n=2 Tax=Meloidogyne enterolobii TaxID=390850 RepID=A0A6V7YD54_MELEN|nr:unnamed protein product [Meloidogyne enterolobii]CAD2197560.1 unnamed protein product [Meloidogyne enterolobii]CAD2209583.1 unnamed protein product [Meloidogyne enterolobii]CAD2209607.1 unnamed protein product [Meloidogyne enterolobii]
MPPWAAAMLEICNSVMELCKDILTSEQEQQQSETNPKSLFGDPFSASKKHQNSSFNDQSYFANILNNAILDADEIKSKSKRVVIERAPDNTDIINIAKKIAADCGVAEDLLENEIHRHPRESKDVINKKPRIVKIPFTNKKSRDNFLYNFRKCLKKNPAFPQFITARRDMTRNELNILYNLRKQAFSMNQAENMFKYIVVDLSIITLKNPQPLRATKNK